MFAIKRGRKRLNPELLLSLGGTPIPSKGPRQQTNKQKNPTTRLYQNFPNVAEKVFDKFTSYTNVFILIHTPKWSCDIATYFYTWW